MPKVSKTIKKPKKPKEDNKPKRPLSGYFRFVAKIRPDLKKSNPDCKMTGISALAAAQWKALSDEAKKPFQDAASLDKPAHDKAMKTYKATAEYTTFVAAKKQYKIDLEVWEEQQEEEE